LYLLFSLSVIGFTASSLSLILLLEGDGSVKLRVVGGYLLFLSWIGIWFFPQLRLGLPTPDSVYFLPRILLRGFGGILLMVGAGMGLKGVMELGFRTSTTHEPGELVTAGVYGRLRHPQYTGGLISHLGISLLTSGVCSILVTPYLMTLLCLLAKKEEDLMTQEFCEGYEEYRERVPMFTPKLG
jgi:protein-S-isoprenylcysteine O-methyltransferase Ste14